MPRGGSRPGAGRPAKPVEEHVLAGTYRRDRHGPLPSNVVQMPGATPPQTQGWTPAPAELGAVGKAGRQFVSEMLGAYEFTRSEGVLVIEAAHITDRLAALRSIARGSIEKAERLSLERLEQGWTRLLASVMCQLRVKS